MIQLYKTGEMNFANSLLLNPNISIDNKYITVKNEYDVIHSELSFGDLFIPIIVTKYNDNANNIVFIIVINLTNLHDVIYGSIKNIFLDQLSSFSLYIKIYNIQYIHFLNFFT